MQSLLSETEIREGVERLAARLTADYAGLPLTVVGVLTGSAIFLTDLVRRIGLPHRIGWVQAASYRGDAQRPGPLQISSELLPDVSDRHVLLVDDIFDTGRTLSALVARVTSAGALSVKTAVLLLKQGRAEVELRPDYVCFTIPDRFVVGYGMDYRDAYRHLSHIAYLEPGDEAQAPG